MGIYELSFLSGGPAQQSVDDYLAHMVHALKVCVEDGVGIGSDSTLEGSAHPTRGACPTSWA